MQRFMAIILILTIICSAAVCFLLNKKQSYAASILIEYTGPQAEQGLNPDNTEIDTSEIYSATIIYRVIENLNLDCSVEAIRSAIHVQPIIPLTETKRETAAIELNSEYEFIPTKFLVTYTADDRYSKEYAREVLESILVEYYILYSQKYIENIPNPNNALHISLDNYDYIECAELLRENINYIATNCMARNAYFYSAKSGYSFPDLQLELEYLRDTALYDLNVFILENQLTRDRDLLLQKERNKLTQYEIKVNNHKKYIDEQRTLIEQFAHKTLDGQPEMEKMDNMGIITDVEKGFTFRDSVDTTYDTLISQYAELLLELNYYQSEMQQTQQIIDIYSELKENNSNEEAGKIAKEKLDIILADFNRLYEAFSLTVKDYYNVQSADYMSFNSNVQATENVNLKLYLVVAVFMFFVVWSCLFIAGDRLREIILFNKNNKSKTDEKLNKGD